MEYTKLELMFLTELEKEAYGGLTFTGDVNPEGMNKNQKSGVVGSLVKKNILAIDDKDGMIGIIPDAGDADDAEWEITQSEVTEVIKRGAKQ